MDHISKAITTALETAEQEQTEIPVNTLTSAELGIDAYNDELRTAVAHAGEFERRLAMGEPIWLSLLGNQGAGKTQIGKTLGRRFQPKMAKVPCSNSASGWRESLQKKQKFHWAFIIKTIRNGDYGIVDYICDDVYFAMIDDLGSGYESDMTKAKAAEIAERRLGKPTIWTSNLNMQEITDEIDLRIASRLMRHGSLVLEFIETLDWNVARHHQQAG